MSLLEKTGQNRGQMNNAKTFSEIARGGPIQAVIDGCGASAEIGLYRPNIDPFEEDEALDWPSDWPSWVTTQFLRDLGIEVIVA